MVRYIDHPDGRRCYVAGRRLHHGLAACLILPLVWHSRVLRTGAIAMLLHDAIDFPWRDCDNRH